MASATQRALARQDNVALMRAPRAGLFAAAVRRSADKVGARVDAGRVYVVVLGEITHSWPWI